MNLATFNLNRIATVKLSTVGLKILLDYRHRHGPTCGKFNEKNNAFETHVWELMMIFGPGMYAGQSPVPFINNEMSVDLESFP